MSLPFKVFIGSSVVDSECCTRDVTSRKMPSAVYNFLVFVAKSKVERSATEIVGCDAKYFRPSAKLPLLKCFKSDKISCSHVDKKAIYCSI